MRPRWKRFPARAGLRTVLGSHGRPPSSEVEPESGRNDAKGAQRSMWILFISKSISFQLTIRNTKHVTKDDSCIPPSEIGRGLPSLANLFKIAVKHPVACAL